ncbi:MAG: 4Fe-4S dicluster domain-containing protein [Bacillota bacterium]
MEISLNDRSFAEEVKAKSGQPIDLCYQCQKCASGCTMTRFTDYTPNQILRMVQMGMKEKVLECSMIWICSSCEICGARCPNGIKMSEVMDALKEIAIRDNVAVREKNIKTFNDIFLGTVKTLGRVNDGILMGIYKVKTKDLFSDLDLGAKLIFKGKLPLITRTVKAKKQIRSIFNQSADHEKQSAFEKCSR